jgi:hypothetical protein
MLSPLLIMADRELRTSVNVLVSARNAFKKALVRGQKVAPVLSDLMLWIGRLPRDARAAIMAASVAEDEQGQVAELHRAVDAIQGQQMPMAKDATAPEKPDPAGSRSRPKRGRKPRRRRPSNQQ